MALPYHINMVPLPIQIHSSPGSSEHSLQPDVIQPIPPDRWHPKITLYHLIVVLLGIGLGSAKAWATWKGETIASITLEWISGVVVSLSLFILSWYDDSDDVPTPLPLLFSYDCLNIFWRIFSIPKPTYHSNERIHITPSVSHSNHLPITGYRILISTIVTIFGVSKMICSYMGLNTAANAIEWVSVAIVGTSLYLLGLYEDNTYNVLPFLFTTDYSGTVQSLFYVALSLAAYVLLTAGCIAWIFWSKSSMKVIPPKIYISTDLETTLNLSSMDVIYNYAIGLLASCIHLLIILVPVPIPLFLLLCLLVLWNSRLYPRVHHGILFVYQKFKTWLCSGTHGSHPSIDHALALGAACVKIIGYIAIHLLAISFFALFGIVCIGLVVKLVIWLGNWDQSAVWIFGAMIVLLILSWFIWQSACFLFLFLESLVQPMRAYVNVRR